MIQPIDAMINHNTNSVFIEDLFVPDECLIGEEGDGFKSIITAMNAERILIAAECIGKVLGLTSRTYCFVESYHSISFGPCSVPFICRPS